MTEFIFFVAGCLFGIAIFTFGIMFAKQELK